MSPGVSSINVSSCINNSFSEIEILIVTNKGIYTKNFHNELGTLTLSEISEPIPSISYTSVSSCSSINSSGRYALSTSIIDSSTFGCMNISSNNVYLTCNGNLIDGDGSVQYGVYIYRSSSVFTNITVENCQISDWNSNVYLYNVKDVTFRNVNSTSSDANYGFYLYNSYNNLFENINSSKNANSEFFLLLSNYNNFSYIDANNNLAAGAGIYFTSSSGNKISNSNFKTNYNGLYFSSANSNSVNNSNMTGNSWSGVQLSGSYNNFSNSNIVLNSGIGGLYVLANSQNNKFVSNNISKTSAGSNLRFDGSGLTNNIFYLNYLPFSGSFSFSSPTFTNTVFNSSLSGNNLGNYWIPISASCLANETRGEHLVCTNPSSYEISLTYNLYDYAPLTQSVTEFDPNIDSCGQISIPGVYTFNASIIDSSTSDCIDITSEDVVIDCNGHTIDGNDVASRGVYFNLGYNTNTPNITLMNCNISNWASYNIYTNGVGGLNLTNINTSSSTGSGFYANTNSFYNKFYNIKSYNNNGYGFNLNNIRYSNFTKLNASNNGNYGFYMYYSFYNNFYDISSSYHTSRGIYFSTSADNNFTKINIYRDKVGFGIDYPRNKINYANITGTQDTFYSGFEFASGSSFDTKISNVLISNYSYGVRALSGYHNNVSNSTFILNGYDLYFASSAYNYTFYNNTFNNRSKIFFSGSSQNHFFNSSELGYNVGNNWNNLSCSLNEARGPFTVCTNPSTYTLSQTYNIYDYAPID